MTDQKPGQQNGDGLLRNRPLYNFDGVEFVEIKHTDWQDILERARKLVITEDDGSREPISNHWRPPTRDGAEGAEPFAWTIPGDDQADCNGFIPTKILREGEFTKPLYATPIVRGDREALKDIARQKTISELVEDGNEVGDLEYAYDTMIKLARSTLSRQAPHSSSEDGQ